MTFLKKKKISLIFLLQLWQQYLFGREGNRSFTGLEWRRSVLCGSTGRCLWWRLTCGINNGGCLGGFIFRDALQIKGNSKNRLSIKKYPHLAVKLPRDRLTLFGVWMGDRASRSVMGNSSPRLRRSSYTCTTPAKEGVLRKASAHDCGVDARICGENFQQRRSQAKTKATFRTHTQRSNMPGSLCRYHSC